jgi:crossover junction endonuclease MUS81
MAEEIKRKRRRKSICPNPLFLKWLEEWRDEAMENGWKTSYTLNKAIRSVKQYPLPLNSGTEARILDNIGEKVARMLDDKLSEFFKNGGTLDELHNGVSNTKRPPKIPDNPSMSHSHTATTSTETSPPQVKTPKGTNNKRKKEYVPAYRSGGYAILVALHMADEEVHQYK